MNSPLHLGKNSDRVSSRSPGCSTAIKSHSCSHSPSFTAIILSLSVKFVTQAPGQIPIFEHTCADRVKGRRLAPLIQFKILIIRQAHLPLHHIHTARFELPATFYCNLALPDPTLKYRQGVREQAHHRLVLLKFPNCAIIA